MAEQLIPNPVFRAWSNIGLPLVGGKLFTYQAGTTAKQATYTDASGGTPNSNPVILNFRGEASVWLDPSKTYKLVLAPSADTDPPTNPFWTVDNISGGGLFGFNLIPSADNTYTLGNTSFSWANVYIGSNHAPVLDTVSGNFGYYARTASEIAAAVTPSNFSYAPLDARRYGAKFDAVTDDTTAIQNAILVAKQTINGAVGNVINLPLGTAVLSSQVTLANDVRFLGTNKNGSCFKASSSWNVSSNPNMFYAVNGGISMFDSIFESMTVDCNNIAGLNAIRSDAWQNNCGPRRCLIYQFTNYGLWVVQGDGGADILPLEDVEIFGSDVSAAVAGIRVEKISSAGNFVLYIDRGVIAGGTSHFLPRGIDIVNDSTILEKVHWEQCTSGLYIDGVGSHVLINCAAASTVTNLVEVASTFTGTLRMIGCRRGSASVFVKDNRVGGAGSIVEDLPDFTISKANGYTVSNITQAASAVATISTVSGTNPIFVGSKLTFTKILGMTQINGLQGTVTAIGGASGAWTATVNINSSGFSAFISSATAGVFTNPVHGLGADNSARAWCTFDGTKTGTNAPTSGFNVKAVTRNSVGNYTVSFESALVSSSSQCIAVTTALPAYSINNQGPASGFAQFILEVLSVSAGVLVATPTDNAFITFVCFGQGY